MNRTGIEWCDYTWNPCTGCSRLCRDETGKIYCYAYWMAQRLKGRYGYPKTQPFAPTFHLDRLLEPYTMKKGQKIFTVSMGDFFDHNIHPLHRDLILAVMDNCPQHDFIVLTKQIDNAIGYFHENHRAPPSNMWLGVSQDGRTTNPDDVSKLSINFRHYNTFVSFEPLLGPVDVSLYGIKWAIIGAQTGRRPKQPRKEWVQAIGAHTFDEQIPLFVKHNVEMSDDERLQEWPSSMNTEFALIQEGKK